MTGFDICEDGLKAGVCKQAGFRSRRQGSAQHLVGQMTRGVEREVALGFRFKDEGA